MKKLLIITIIPFLLVGCAYRASNAQPPESSVAASQESNPEIQSSESVSGPDQKTPELIKPDGGINNVENQEERRQATQDTIKENKQTLHAPLVSPEHTGIVEYQQVTTGRVGPVVVKNFPRGKIHKRDSLNISWSSEGATGYTYFMRAGKY